MVGGIEAIVVTALIKGLFAVVKSQIKTFGKGGYIEQDIIRGPSHSQGGVIIEAEGGEGIINKKAMSSPEVITTTGTPYQIASEINQAIPGAGKPFPGTPKRKLQGGGPVDGTPKRKLQKGGPVITVTGTPKQIIRQVLQAGGIVEVEKQKVIVSDGIPGSPGVAIPPGSPIQVLQSGGIVEAEGGEGFINRKAMDSSNLIQVSGTPYQITKGLNKAIPGKGISYLSTGGVTLPSGIYQEGGVLGTTPQIVLPEQITSQAEK